ncbi:MAG: hypothetical protein IT317_17235 [Anaerolineales bacterium]|nr:hypothetical protein [Anaerolineales bacterium]
MRHRRWAYRGLGVLCLALGVVLAAATVTLAGGGLFPRNLNPFLSRKGIGDATEAGQYYSVINAPLTLADWKNAYFPPSGGSNRASANYYNAGDLGFGRAMHCYEEANFTACYVANHGLGAAAPAEISVQATIANTHQLPTVAMVYDYLNNGQPNDVTFYAYDVNGNLLTHVALDGEGDKYLPHLCLPCHGGTYNSTNNTVSDAQFLPFDLESFAYSPTAGWTRAAQTEQFRVLNAMVRNALPDAKIANLLDGWYGGVAAVYNPNAVFNDDFIPAAYNGNAADQQMYSEVVKPYCRGCHMAQGYDLETPSQLDSAFNAVFVDRDMPHAELTSHRFWTSPAPTLLALRFAGTRTFVVTNTGDSTPDGCTPAATTNGCTLREAVNAANANADHSVIVFDDITVSLSLFGANEDLNATGDLDLRTDMTILGHGLNYTDIIGNEQDRVFHVSNGATVLMQNLIVSNGSALRGGGILVSGSGSDLILNNVALDSNEATDGGGLAVDNSAAAEVHQSTILFNIVTNAGGGVFVDNFSTVTLYDTTIGENGASGGGGVFSGNGSTAALDQVTLVRNAALIIGRGVLVYEGAWVYLSRSIVMGNTNLGLYECMATDGGQVVSNGYNLVGQNGNADGCPANGAGDSVPAGGLATVLVDAFPTFGSTGLAFYPPVATSPALDAIPLGAYCTTPAYDQVNAARPRDADNNGVLGCDIGAVERVALPIFIPLVGR